MSLIRAPLHFQLDRRCFETLISHALQIRVSDRMVFEAVVSSVLIGFHDSWSGRCREIVIKSALGNTTTRRGLLLSRTTALRGYSSPLEFLRHKWAFTKTMDRSWEPDWFLPQNSIRAAKLLVVANENEITNGLGASLIPERLRVARNVVAHSLPNTWKRLRDLHTSLGVPPMLRPADFVMSYSAQSGRRLIHEWLDEIEISIKATIE
jgi:hypothetical protein